MTTHVDKLNFDLHKPSGLINYKNWLSDNIVPPAHVIDVWYAEGMKQPIVIWSDTAGGGGSGPQGFQGSAGGGGGAQGPQGFQGVGVQGNQGTQGLGANGSQGRQGIQGPIGVWG